MLGTFRGPDVSVRGVTVYISGINLRSFLGRPLVLGRNGQINPPSHFLKHVFWASRNPILNGDGPSMGGSQRKTLRWTTIPRFAGAPPPVRAFHSHETDGTDLTTQWQDPEVRLMHRSLRSLPPPPSAPRCHLKPCSHTLPPQGGGGTIRTSGLLLNQ